MLLNYISSNRYVILLLFYFIMPLHIQRATYVLILYILYILTQSSLEYNIVGNIFLN